MPHMDTNSEQNSLQEQVKPNKKKRRKNLNMREQKFKKLVLAGVKPTQAMREAGYSESTALGKSSEKVVKCGLPALMDKMGLTDERIIGTTLEALSANKCISAMVVHSSGEGMADAHGMTKDFVEVPDWQNRLKAVEISAKFKGHLREKTELELIGPITVEVVSYGATLAPKKVDG